LVSLQYEWTLSLRLRVDVPEAFLLVQANGLGLAF